MRKRLYAAMLVSALCLTGCSSVPDMEEAQRNMEAEYIAGAMMRHNQNNGETLEYDRSILTATPTPRPTRKPAAATAKPASGSSMTGGKSQTASETTETAVSASEVFGLKQIDIRLEASEQKSSYDSRDVSVSARAGKKLLVVRFRIKNNNASARKVNLQSKQLQYVLKAGDVTVGSPLLTILQNDMQYLSVRLKAGQSTEAVLLFETEKKQSLKDAVITVSDGKKIGEMTLQ